MRFLRFNLVSALGVVVQLGVLSALVHVMDYLVGAVLAVIVAVIHNFAWHWHWTWRDSRHGNRTMAGHFVRFALANGFISLAGNAVVMLALVGSHLLHPLPANVVAIGVCGLLNFWTSDKLVFGAGRLSLDRSLQLK